MDKVVIIIHILGGLEATMTALSGIQPPRFLHIYNFQITLLLLLKSKEDSEDHQQLHPHSIYLYSDI